MRVLLFLLLTAMTTSTCIPKSDTHSWDFLEFSEVRAFQFNWEDPFSFDKIIKQDGSLHDSRIPEEGVLLSDEEIARLEAAVTGTHPVEPKGLCLYPHHAFVFYGRSGDIVGHIDICFMCSNFSGKPSGYAPYWDLEGLEELVTDLGMPLRNPNWFSST